MRPGDPIPRDIPAAWAHAPSHGSFAHWYLREEGGHLVRVVRSVCGLVTGYESAAARLLEPGKRARCKHCARMMERAA